MTKSSPNLAPLLLLWSAAALAAPPLGYHPPDPARAPAPPTAETERVSTLVVFGRDSCPRGRGDEIIVCARLPENERYRIPKRFRGKRDTGPAATAWGAKVRDMEYVGRSGMPDSCTPVGTDGQTGCYRQFLAQARAERQAEKDAAGGE